MPSSMTGMGASGVTASNTTCAMPPSVRAPAQRVGRPYLRHDRDRSRSGSCGGRSRTIASPSRRLAPGPTSSVGCGMGSSPVTTPAARIAVDSPTERTTSPTIPASRSRSLPHRPRSSRLHRTALPARAEQTCRPRSRRGRFVWAAAASRLRIDLATAARCAGRGIRPPAAAAPLRLRGRHRPAAGAREEWDETSRRHQPGVERPGLRVHAPASCGQQLDVRRLGTNGSATNAVQAAAALGAAAPTPSGSAWSRTATRSARGAIVEKDSALLKSVVDAACRSPPAGASTTSCRSGRCATCRASSATTSTTPACCSSRA